jgi:hypothetical protein
VLDWLSLAGPICGQTLDSALGVGTSETFQSPLVDAHTSLDNGFGLDDQEFFSFDDYTYPDSELALQAYGEIAVTSHSLQPSITHQPSLPSDLQSSGSSSTSFPHIQDSSGSAVPTSSLVSSKSPSPTSRSSPASATKLVISPSSFFRCPVCQKTFPFESRLNTHMDIHDKTFTCTVEGCDRTFGEGRARTKHLHSFHKRKMYKACSRCGHEFYRKDKYDLHMKNCPTMRKKRKFVA